MKLQLFNWVHFVYLLLAVATSVVLPVCLRKKSKEQIRKAMFWTSIALVVLMCVHKITLTVFLTRTWTSAMPLHLCNIIQILLPVAFSKKGEKIQGAMFLLGVPSGFAAIMFPMGMFVGQPIYYPDVFLFFATHILQIALSLVPIVLGHYRLTYKDAIFTLIGLFGFALVSHLLNFTLRATHLSADANYFFTYNEPGTAAIEFAYKLIPVPLVWQFPLIPVLLGVFVLEVFVAKRIYKKLDAKNNKEPQSELKQN